MRASAHAAMRVRRVGTAQGPVLITSGKLTSPLTLRGDRADAGSVGIGYRGWECDPSLRLSVSRGVGVARIDPTACDAPARTISCAEHFSIALTARGLPVAFAPLCVGRGDPKSALLH